MTKKAHITSKTEVEVGDRVLGLCGKEFKVKVMWDDLPTDKPICRACVDVALMALTEADALIQRTRRITTLLIRQFDMLGEALTDDDLLLDVIATAREGYEAEQRDAAEDEEAERRAQSTCTCEWIRDDTSDGDGYRIAIDDDCPIHGGSTVIFTPDEQPPVAPDES